MQLYVKILVHDGLVSHLRVRLSHKVYFPDREVDAAHLYPFRVKLLIKLSKEVIDLALEMILETFLANLLMHTSFEPFDDGVFNLTDAL